MSAGKNQTPTTSTSETVPPSSPKSLRLSTYARALRSYLEGVLAVAGPPMDSVDDSIIRHLRLEYGVTQEEHAAIWEELLRSPQTTADPLAETLEAIEHAAQTIDALEGEPSTIHDFLADILRQIRARSIDSMLRSMRVATDLETREFVRTGLLSDDVALRQAAIEALRAGTTPEVAARIADASFAHVGAEAQLPTLTDWLRTHLPSSDPYVRALALYALHQRGAAGAATWQHLSADPHDLVRETAQYVKRCTEPDAEATDGPAELITLQKLVALRAAPVLASLSVESLAELAAQSLERHYAPGEVLCVQGEQSTDVFILLSGEVKVVHSTDGEERVIGAEAAGGFIGEMAALSPAPRMATVIAGPSGVHALCLPGEHFREALGTDMTAAYGVIRTLAERLRKAVERGIRQQIQIQQLRVEIDEVKKARQVAEITDTDYFRRLQERAKRLRTRTSASTQELEES
jgi:CRP/FNR family transcriptional regulator, cyclic AMP receptor protein